jgi:hypothetical protein
MNSLVNPLMNPLMNRIKNALGLTVVPLLALACSRTPEPDPTPAVPKPPVAAPSVATSTAATAAASGGLAWDAPSAWTKVENPSPMRKATYKIPKAEGDVEQPELAVTTAGGSIDANVDRWVGQFDEGAKGTLKRETKKVGAWDVTIAEMKGTFSGMAMPGAPNPGGPKPGWAMLAAIVPVDGDTRWFFKMTGPDKSVAAARKDFDAMIGSLRAQ